MMKKMMKKTSLLNVAHKTLMVLGAAYLMNCGSSVLGEAEADDPGYTEHTVMGCNATAEDGPNAAGLPWARIEVPGATVSQLERAVVLRRQTADSMGETFIEGMFSSPALSWAVRLGDDFDHAIWVRCQGGGDADTYQFAALVPNQ